MANLDKTTLIILIPNPGLVATPFFKSMIGLTQELRNRGIAFAVKTYEFSDIVMSRNYLMSYFLSNRMFTHALCLDCDLEFGIDQFFRLLALDVDCAIAPYPRRQMSVQKLTAEIAANLQRPADKRLNTRQVLARTLGHVAQFSSSDPTWQSQRRGDFVTLPSAGMGFTLIRRNVPEAMVAARVVDHFPEQGKLEIHADAPEFYNFFNHTISPNGHYIMGEDQSFFHRWVFGCKGEVWADTKASLRHHGPHGFQGDFSADRRMMSPDA